MKQSKILKMISYIVIPILIMALVLSIVSIIMKENNYYNKEQYFASDEFVSSYMGYLSEKTYDLIHDKNTFHSTQDGDIKIQYTSDEHDYYDDLKNRYFLIIYKNKALTNVPINEQTFTIDSIKSYIEQNKDSKKVNIIYGNMEADSKIIQDTGVRYLSDLNKTYYTIESIEDTEQPKREYITAKAEDFQIFSSYTEDFYEYSQVAIMNNILDKVSIFKEYCYFIIPVSTILIILILMYLIISIGYKKGEDGIVLNDFDKTPLEIIIFFAIIIGCIPFILLEGITRDYNGIISLVVTGGLVIYVLCAIILNTTIKRIKSKTFFKSTITGKILKWICVCGGVVYHKLKIVWDTLTYSSDLKVKVIIKFIIISALAIFIFLVFHNSGMVVVLEFILIAVTLYKIIKFIKNCSQIERKLKEMYEEDNSNKLYEEDFGNEFKNSVRYLNNISNGFENAIQDRMKSERMKIELITNVSHDIKTPLTSIINYVDLLKKENINNEQAKEYIEILDSKSQRLKKLTEDLVEASKVSTGNISLNLEKINVVELVKQATGEFEDKFKKRGLETIINADKNEVDIMADSRYMYRIIENLFSNVSKYALENSRVYIDIKQSKEDNLANNVIIEVKNISKDKLNISAEELMQRFVRGDKSRTTEGSGLGISIAQNLTELQKGKFELKLDGDLFKVKIIFAKV
ncbi:MAG: HAMP domain-containing sensor histidine kinase [Clostridia bacterium]